MENLTGLVVDEFGTELRSWSVMNSITVNLPILTNTSLRFVSNLRGATLGLKVCVLPLASSCLVEVARLSVGSEDIRCGPFY